MSLYSTGRDADGRTRWHFWCPGCDEVHGVSDLWAVTENPDGTLTVDPSIKVTRPGVADYCCHSYLRNGVWEFLTDSTHALAGQTAPMAPWPYDD